MGATVSTAKHVAAFRALSGAIVYVLFEQKYEKNVYPHTPAWGCVFIGELEATMKRIFERGAGCEGGMLQSRSGHVTPEGYIAGWLKEMVAPYEMGDRTINLKAGTNYNSTIMASKLDAVSAVLARLGRQDIADALAVGQSVPISLYGDADVVTAIYGDGDHGAWRILSQPAFNGAQRPDFGYSPAQAKSVNFTVPSFLKVDNDNRLVQRPDGTWYCGGWAYRMVEAFVCDQWEVELREPGSYRKRIKAYRDAMEAAPAMPAGVRVEINLTVSPRDDYEGERIFKLMKVLPHEVTPLGYSVAYPTEGDRDAQWTLTNLSEACQSWLIPGNPNGNGTQQLSLLEAA